MPDDLGDSSYVDLRIEKGGTVMSKPFLACLSFPTLSVFNTAPLCLLKGGACFAA
jgi:hypothetical protein